MARSSTKELARLMTRAAGRRNLYDVFADFCEMAAISISNACDLRRRDEREARYMAIIKRYEKDERRLFPQMVAELVMVLEGGADDVLGRLFSELELHNAARGQFFTPQGVCQLMAGVNLRPDDVASLIAEKGCVTLAEPTVGAGAMVIAYADMMRQLGYDPSRQLHVTAQDIDSRAVHMAYVQLSLLGIPAAIVLGNTLTLECKEVWYTPAHIFGGWGFRLRQRHPNPVLERAPAGAELPPPITRQKLRLWPSQITGQSPCKIKHLQSKIRSRITSQSQLWPRAKSPSAPRRKWRSFDTTPHHANHITHP